LRGLLKRLVTRVYFADDPHNNDDPVLSLIHPTRRHTLIAQMLPGTNGNLRWDVVLQGPKETVFLDC
jgi:protocatechuate 3,4-dioxygenase alpha subunit